MKKYKKPKTKQKIFPKISFFLSNTNQISKNNKWNEIKIKFFMISNKIYERLLESKESQKIEYKLNMKKENMIYE